jgi:hypothetical protein
MNWLLGYLRGDDDDEERYLTLREASRDLYTSAAGLWSRSSWQFDCVLLFPQRQRPQCRALEVGL